MASDLHLCTIALFGPFAHTAPALLPSIKPCRKVQARGTPESTDRGKSLTGIQQTCRQTCAKSMDDRYDFFSRF